MKPFTLFGPSHIAALLITVALAVIGILVLRLGSQSPEDLRRRNQIISWLICGLILAGLLVRNIFRWWDGFLNIHYDLPMQLCDWVYTLLFFALLTRKAWLFELTFFWGLGGSLQALLTPAVIWADFPHYNYIEFFLIHGSIVVGIAYLALGVGLKPRKYSVWFAFGAAQIYFLSALLVNILTDSNYGFLMERPDVPVKDLMGAEPWHILFLELVGLLSFFLWYSPYFLMNFWRRRTNNRENSPSISV